MCNDENPCEGMSRHATFENFGMAFLTLFQVSTGDNWNGIMKVIEAISGDIFCAVMNKRKVARVSLKRTVYIVISTLQLSNQ